MIRDSVDNFELTDDILRQHGNEVGVITYLFGGLEYLYRQVDAVEVAVRERIGPVVHCFFVGNAPALAGVPQGLLTCCFHWYAVSACNCVKMIGWMRRQHDTSAPEAQDYVRSVLPEVLTWRDKVAAHFARHTPKRKDTTAELEASVLAPVGFEDGSFFASPMTLTTNRGGQSSTSAALRPWSLTKVHKQLRARYEQPDSA